MDQALLDMASILQPVTRCSSSRASGPNKPNRQRANICVSLEGSRDEADLSTKRS